MGERSREDKRSREEGEYSCATTSGRLLTAGWRLLTAATKVGPLLSEAILYAIVSYVGVCQTLGLAYKWGVKVLLEDQCLLIFRTN